MKKYSLYIMVVFYVLAGINHFINPSFYLPLIPPFFPFPEAINFIAGVIEVLLGIGVLIPKTRRISSIAIVLMLIAFIPSHVYFIQIGGCIEEGLCAPPWIGWFRLIIIHPILIFWAWSNRK